MAHCFHQLYYHFVWATHERESLISRSWRPRLLEIIREEILRRGGQPIRQNALDDHVHSLVRLPPTVPISEFIGRVKGAASFRVNQELSPDPKLRWQDGYGVLSIRKDEVAKVSTYIDHQEEHHRNRHLSELLERLHAVDDEWMQFEQPCPLKGAGEKK